MTIKRIYLQNFLAIVLITFLLIPDIALAKKNEPFFVASYNLRYDNPHDGVNGWSNRKDQVKALIQFHDFDIFGTQEGLINQVKGIAELKRYNWIGVGRDDGKEAGEHCAVFYRKDRFKLLQNGDFWLSETPDKPTIGWDSKVNKRVCTWGKFRDLNTKKEFYFITVHFDNIGSIARRESAKLMIQRIPEITKGKPVICVGDFNSTPETEQIGKMKSLFRDAYEVTEEPPYGPVGTTNGFQFDAPMKYRIDYIFISKQIDVLKYGVLTDSYQQRYPSDHQPIMAKIIIN
jgi:endonuclease/exonuclease/phosphatase family metal-dependent hydrolase